MKHTTNACRLLALLLSVLLSFCGCTQSVFAQTDGSDAPEIEIEIEETTPIPPPIETDTDAVTEAVPITETLPPAGTEAAVFPTDTAVSRTEAAVTEPPVTTEETEPVIPAPVTRIAVPRLSGRPASDAKALLDAAGISYTVIEQYSAEKKAGYVITTRFHGVLDDSFCHINPNYPVELVVSLGYRPKINAAAVDPKHIYLTFDDGPHKNTDRVLEILAEYGAKATFFTLGTYVTVYPERTRAIVDGGHLIACHSYSHDYLSLYQSADSVLGEISAWERAVTAAGVPLPQTVYFRFPGGTTTSYMARDRYESIFWAVTDAGYLTADWTCANNDRYLNHKTEEQTLQEYLLESVKTTLRSLAWTPTTPKIMLMHDTADETVETLPQILEYLIGQGYTFATLDELDGYWVFH